MGTGKTYLIKMANFLFVIIILALLLVLARYIDSRKAPGIRERVEELYLNGEFAIGTVSSVSGNTYTKVIVLGDIRYRFETLAGIKHGVLGGALPEQISAATDSLFRRRLSTGITSGNQFLVLYDESNPKNAILLLEHPIKSDADFERYKAEIEELRKSPEWRGFK